MDADLILLDRWRDGDRSAGQDLFKRHFPDVHRFFDNKCRGDADDLVQRTFYQCVRARDRFRGQSSFRTYLFSIARHELYQHLRDVRRDVQLDFHVTSIAEIVTTAGSRLARAQQTERLRHALSSLPVEDQVLLEMHYWHELDSTALGEVFEMPAATVRTKLARARKALRARLDAADIDPRGDRLAASLGQVDDDLGSPCDG
ncbi:MAG: sigma-70 family RNA polymerase sigma factor [Minicystis sp.]